MLLAYLYYRYTKKEDKQRGLSFDPKDSKYDPIGGIGGSGWM